MPKHLTVATVIEKNRVSSDVPFLELLEITIESSPGVTVEVIRIAKNSEMVTFEGHDFTASNFTLNVDTRVGEEPTVTITAKDPTGVIRGRMEQYDGGVGFPVRYLIVNSARLDKPAEIDEQFSIIAANAPPGFEVSFSLGAESPLRMRFPISVQEKDRCRFKYKGTRCKYAGEMSSCSFTLDGANGCRAHDNEENFGAFPALKNVDV